MTAADLKISPTAPIVRFLRKVDVNGPVPEHAPELGPCMLWTGALNSDGYGVFRPQQRLELAHRFAYRALVGRIPRGLILDHLCRNHACVSPGHLEAVTRRTNNLRGEHPSVVAHNAGTCTRGHEQTSENGYYRKGRPQEWYCRVCAQERRQARRAA